MLPGHIVTGKGIELAQLLPGFIGNAARTYCYWQGNRVGQIAARINWQSFKAAAKTYCSWERNVDQIAARINWQIFRAAARTYCYWQGNRVGQMAARINRQCCQDILLLARE
jgi:hypothetical protein